MAKRYRVAVIGGGVIGCSVLYHLTKLGWKDVCLLERKELTAGSTWHAAGGFHSLSGNPGLARLQSYTVRLYPEIQKLSGQDVGLHRTGGLSIVSSQDWWDFLRADQARHKLLGIHTELLGPGEIKRLYPLVEIDSVLGGVFDPDDGHVDPSGVTHAYAKAARLAGAEVLRHTRVTALRPSGRQTWNLTTDTGVEIEAEHVVNAAGLWAREVGSMAGVKLPLIPIEHHYLITDDIPEVLALDRELPFLADLDGEIYIRQERGGVLVGVYEKAARPWAVAGTPWDYGQNELLPPDIDRLTDELAIGYARFPAIANAGIRRIINGPFTFSPDGNPLIGPVQQAPNYWVACGVMAGFSQGGGVGLAVAQWIVNGEPEGDLHGLDVARFGPYATPAYVEEKATEFYANRFQMPYPNRFWPAGRINRTSVLFDLLQQKRAIFGVSFGLEIPMYFAPLGEEPVEQLTLRRSNAFGSVAGEVRALSAGVGVLDNSSSACYEISGRECAAALDEMFANTLPGIGELVHGIILSQAGRLNAHLLMTRVASDQFMLWGPGYLQSAHQRWFGKHLPASVSFSNVSDGFVSLVLAGPRSRELLQRMTRDDCSDAAFPFMSVRNIALGYAPATVMRYTVTGELGFTVCVAATQLRALYETLFKAGSDFGIVDFGLYALNSMRLEHGVGTWNREFSPDFSPNAAGLDGFIDFTKPSFIGRAAAVAQRAAAPNQILASFLVDAPDVDPSGYEPIWRGKEMVGFATSGGYGHRLRSGIALGYIDAAMVDEKGLEMSVFGQRRSAVPRPLRKADAELLTRNDPVVG